MRILMIDLDATRPDHLGCYGYHRDTSPNIDSIAKEGVRFTNYYTTDAPCLPSRSALTSGQFGIHNGVVGHGGTAAHMRHEGAQRAFQDRLTTDSLAGVLRRAGLHTALISPFGERHSSWPFYAGYNEIYNTGKSGLESAEEVTPVVLDWIGRNGQRDDWFLYVNYWDAHTPYRAPEDFGNPFADEPLPGWITDEVLERHLQQVGPHGAREINMYDNQTLPNYPRHPGEITDRASLRQMLDGYDTGIRFVDDNIGLLFQALVEQGIMDDTVVIITADHGENQGELGIYGEHATADFATCRIPMIIRWPGKTQGLVDNALHYHIDLNPTLAALLDTKAADTWDGRSYAATIAEGRDSGRDYLVVSQNAHVCQRSVRFQDYLYIRTYHDGYHLFDKEMLFDVKEDPHEQVNLAREKPEVCREAVYLLNEWHDEMMMSMDSEVDPMWTVLKEGGPWHARGHLQQYTERLADTDRGDAIPELKRRHPKEFQ